MSFPATDVFIELMSKTLQMNQQAPAYLYSAARCIQGANPQHRIDVQTEIDQMVSLYSVLHSIKMFETYWRNTLWGHSYIDPNTGQDKHALDSDQLQQLLAYRHIRHVAAHGMDGKRTDEKGNTIGTQRTEFESVMNSPRRLAGVTITPDLITVSPGVVFSGLQQLLHSAAQRGAAHADAIHRSP